MPRRRKRQRIGENKSPLRQLREDADLTQEQLAVYIGVAVSSIRRWEKGDEPTLTVLQMRAFCRAVQVSFDQLPNYLSFRAETGEEGELQGAEARDGELVGESRQSEIGSWETNRDRDGARDRERHGDGMA